MVVLRHKILLGSVTYSCHLYCRVLTRWTSISTFVNNPSFAFLKLTNLGMDSQTLQYVEMSSKTHLILLLS